MFFAENKPLNNGPSTNQAAPELSFAGKLVWGEKLI